MRILLDENFPIQLHRRLRDTGHEADHIIALGLRGISDEEAKSWNGRSAICSGASFDVER